MLRLSRLSIRPPAARAQPRRPRRRHRLAPVRRWPARWARHGL